MSTFTPPTRQETGYDESPKRKDLTWQESARATAALYALRSAPATGPVPTIRSLSEELRGHGSGKAYVTTRQELIVAKHLDDEEVASAPSLKEALKILKRREIPERARTFSAAAHKAYNTDAIRWMRECPAEIFDVILTAPPYWIGADTDDWQTVEPLLRSIITDGFRVSKAEAHLYLFCDFDHFAELRQMAAEAGWKPFRTPLIWEKGASKVRVPWPDQGPRHQYETILYAVKGERKTISLQSDVISIPQLDVQHEYRPQKPVELYRNLLSRSCWPGNTVLDPCMGSGTIFEAAHEMKCLATGLESSSELFSIAVKRLGELK
jgi:DNA modification methylase